MYSSWLLPRGVGNIVFGCNYLMKCLVGVEWSPRYIRRSSFCSLVPILPELLTASITLLCSNKPFYGNNLLCDRRMSSPVLSYGYVAEKPSQWASPAISFKDSARPRIRSSVTSMGAPKWWAMSLSTSCGLCRRSPSTARSPLVSRYHPPVPLATTIDAKYLVCSYACRFAKLRTLCTFKCY